MNPLTLKNVTKTSIFFLPLALSDDINYREFVTKDFINAYVDDIVIPDNNMVIYVKRKTNKQELFGAVKKVKNNEYTIYHYELPMMRKSQLKDYALLISGDYSKISDESKERILSFWDEKEGSELYAILNKDPDLFKKRAKTSMKIKALPTEGELYPPFELLDEILN